MAYYLGIDVGGTKIAYGLFDGNKNLLAKKKTETNTQLSPEAFFDLLYDEIHLFLKNEQVLFENVQGIGIGLPSFVHYEKGYIVQTGSIPQLHHFPAREYLTHKFGDSIKIAVDNDGNTGALAEYRYGAGQGFDNVIFCLVSTGLGSSYIINKSLFRGSYGWAGESGHTLTMLSDAGTVNCGCGNEGCFNAYGSGKMIVDHIKKWIDDGEETIMIDLAGGADKISAKIINIAYEQEDAMAQKAVEQMAQFIAVWLYNMYLVLNINCFVLSGGLLEMGDKLFNRVRELFDSYNKNEYPVNFFTSKLGEDTGIIGAMELLFE